MPPFIDAAKSKNATPIILKEMEFHQTIDLGRVHILRVWGGWIYYSFEAAKVVSAVFVPQRTLSDEQEQQLDDEKREKLPKLPMFSEEDKVEAQRQAQAEILKSLGKNSE